FLNSELAGMETTTLPSFLPASTTFFHSSAEAPQLLGENTNNRIATVMIQTALLCRSRERTIRNSLLSLFCNEGPLKNCRYDFQIFTKETGKVVKMKISLFSCSI